MGDLPKPFESYDAPFDQQDVGTAAPSSLEIQLRDLFVQLADTKHNYSTHWYQLSETLRAIEETAPEHIHFGPTYTTATSRDQKVAIQTLFFDYTDQRENPTRDYFFIARDAGGRILGDRVHQVKRFKDREYIGSSGLLTVNEKGVGVATTFDLVILDILQREANAQQRSVHWAATNANAPRVAELRSEHQQLHNEQTANRLAVAEAEQQRWQALYGPQGKLGMGRKQGLAGREFIPNGPPEDLENIEQIQLTRTETQLGLQPKVLSLKKVASEEEQHALREQRLQELRELLNQSAMPSLH